MKHIFLSMIVGLIFTLTACGTDTGSDEPVEKPAEEKTAEQEEGGSEDPDADDTAGAEEKSAASEEQSVIDTPTIPVTFKDAVEYPIVGEFSGDITYNDDFINYPELAEVYKKFLLLPKIVQTRRLKELKAIFILYLKKT